MFFRLVEGGSNIEANYAASMLEWARQIFDGPMAYSAVTTDTVATLRGRPPIKLEHWARQHRSDIGTWPRGPAILRLKDPAALADRSSW
jgi:hypothetical protein